MSLGASLQRPSSLLPASSAVEDAVLGGGASFSASSGGSLTSGKQINLLLPFPKFLASSAGEDYFPSGMPSFSVLGKPPLAPHQW